MTEHYRYTGERMVDSIILTFVGVTTIIGFTLSAGSMLVVLGVYKLVYALTYKSQKKQRLIRVSDGPFSIADVKKDIFLLHKRTSHFYISQRLV